jgi:MoxR-like ATPase
MPVATAEDLLRIQSIVHEAVASRALVEFAVGLVQASRPATTAIPAIRDYVAWGVGPRAAQALILAAKARALMRGRPQPDYADVVHLAPSIFRHRLVLSYAAEADEVDAERIVAMILEHVSYPGRPAARVRTPWWRRWIAALSTPSVPRRAGA